MVNISFFFPSAYFSRLFAMRVTRTIIILLVMSRVAVNTRQLSCSNGRVFIATEGKALPAGTVIDVPPIPPGGLKGTNDAVMEVARKGWKVSTNDEGRLGMGGEGAEG